MSLVVLGFLKLSFFLPVDGFFVPHLCVDALCLFLCLWVFFLFSKSLPVSFLSFKIVLLSDSAYERGACDTLGPFAHWTHSVTHPCPVLVLSQAFRDRFYNPSVFAPADRSHVPVVLSCMFQGLVPLGSEIKAKMMQLMEERTEANMVTPTLNVTLWSSFTNPS